MTRPAAIDLDDLIARGVVTAINGVPVAMPTEPPVDEDAEEKDFAAALRKEATEQGFTCYHTRDSRKSDKGFPDETMVRVNQGGPLLIFAELKTATGELTADQRTWAELLSAVERATNGVVMYRTWRPADWNAIVAALA